MNSYINIKSLVNQLYKIPDKEEVGVVKGAAAANGSGVGAISRVNIIVKHIANILR